MPKGVYVRIKKHPVNCRCCSCRAQRKEYTGKNHPMYGLTEELSPSWKGDDVGCPGIHWWLMITFGKATYCENSTCLGGKRFEWSKKDHNTPYKRNREDYHQLCSKCHRNYDRGKILINER